MTRKFILSLWFLLLATTASATDVSLPFSHDFNALSPFSSVYKSYSIVTDTTSPGSSSVLRITYPSGYADGYAPDDLYVGFPAQREMYFQWYFKYSSNWTAHPVVDKQVYVWSNNSDDNFYIGVGHFSRGLTLDLQGTGGSGSLDSRELNIQNNRWYKITAHVVLNTGSNSDGSGQLWLDDVLVLNKTGLKYWNNADKMRYFDFTPVWGGYQGDKVPSTQYLYLDNPRISTAPFGSTPTPSPDPAPKAPGPPSSLQID